MNLLLSTQTVPEKERFSYWNHLISQALGRLDTKSLGVSSFTGKIYANQLADLDFVEVASNKLSVIRTDQLISQETSEYFKINFHLAGEGWLIQNGREVQLQPGDWVVYDNTRPYRLTFNGDYKQRLILVPKAQLEARLPDIENTLAQPLSSTQGLGKVTANFVHTTWSEMGQLGLEASKQLNQTLIELLVSNLREVSQTVAAVNHSRAVTLLEIKHYIDEHLHDNQLSVGMIAQALHISKRYLHHLFEQEELSITRYLWEKRLERCKADLSAPHLGHRSITDIAHAWGFRSSAHFSRLFKERYGLSARTYRNQMQNSL